MLAWVGWLGHVILDGRLGEEVRAWWVVVAFVAWSLLGPALAGHLPTGAGVARLFDWCAIPIGWWALRSLSLSSRRWLVIASAAALLLCACVAGLQHFGAWPALEAFSALSWTHLPFHRVYEAVPGTDNRFMGGGLHFHRLKFAHVSGLVVIVLAALATTAPPRARVALWGAAIAGVIAVGVFSFARAADAAITFAVAVLVLVAWGRQGVVAVGALCALVAILFSAQPALRERFGQALTHEGSGERTEHWRLGLKAAEAHAFFGMGAGQYQPAKVADAQTSDVVRENPGKSHLQLLSIAAETGIVGLLLFIAVWVTLLRRARHPLAWALLAYFCVLSLGHDPLYQAPFSMGLAVAWVVALYLGRDERDQAQNSPSTRR